MSELPLQHRPCAGVRVDSDKDGLDDVYIQGDHILSVHIERMDKGQFWARVYMKDRPDLVMWFDSKSKISALVREE